MEGAGERNELQQAVSCPGQEG